MNEERRSWLRHFSGTHPVQLLSDEEFREVSRMVAEMRLEGGAA